ncbi:MAG: hypothetical protein GX442_24915 [Candidatus Riflebacteria bacterium]|nr:hypothetical protein [Candidatus Riflebacteria bacterium]
MLEALLPVFVLVGIVALVFALLHLAQASSKKRIEDWKQAAGSLGLSWKGTDEKLAERFPGFYLFKWGDRRRADNCLTGTRDGVQITVADYSYTAGTGKQRSTTGQSICLLTAPDLDLPPFLLRKEFKLLDAIGKAIGGKDINFPDDKEFSDAFVLQAEDEAAVRRLFTRPVRRAFLTFKGTNVLYEARGPTMLFHRHDHVGADDLRKMVHDGFDILAALRESRKDA